MLGRRSGSSTNRVFLSTDLSSCWGRGFWRGFGHASALNLSNVMSVSHVRRLAIRLERFSDALTRKSMKSFYSISRPCLPRKKFLNRALSMYRIVLGALQLFCCIIWGNWIESRPDSNFNVVRVTRKVYNQRLNFSIERGWSARTRAKFSISLACQAKTRKTSSHLPIFSCVLYLARIQMQPQKKTLSICSKKRVREISIFKTLKKAMSRRSSTQLARNTFWSFTSAFFDCRMCCILGLDLMKLTHWACKWWTDLKHIWRTLWKLGKRTGYWMSLRNC